MLVERLAVDAVREPLHHERPVGEHRRMTRRHPRVVAEQIALGELQRRPEHLAQVGDGQRVAAGQLEGAVLAAVLEVRSVDDARSRWTMAGVRASGSCASGVVTGCGASRAEARAHGLRCQRAEALRHRSPALAVTRGSPVAGPFALADDVARLRLSSRRPEVHRMPQLVVRRSTR